MTRSVRIFVVDDDAGISNTLTLILNSKGFAARGFIDPVEALKLAGPDLPDLLISDVTMPDITGVELAILMRAVCPTCRVLLLSGQPANASLLHGARTRGYDFKLLQKPVHPDAILAAIAVA